MVEEAATQNLGHSMVHMSSACGCGECNLGNFICDGFMHSVSEKPNPINLKNDFYLWTKHF